MDKLLIDDAYRSLRKDRAAATTPRPVPSESELRKQARVAELKHFGPRGVGEPDTARRIVIGEAETPFGRIRVEHDQAADVVRLHGVSVDLGDIDNDLRNAIVASSAAFARAENEQEQTTARALVGVVVSAILARHEDFIGAKVHARIARERYES